MREGKLELVSGQGLAVSREAKNNDVLIYNQIIEIIVVFTAESHLCFVYKLPMLYITWFIYG